jgi:hypothetical protein
MSGWHLKPCLIITETIILTIGTSINDGQSLYLMPTKGDRHQAKTYSNLTQGNPTAK